ncbi:hypothetical protein ACP4OV_009774 [Aristida adscensionis]
MAAGSGQRGLATAAEVARLGPTVVSGSAVQGRAWRRGPSTATAQQGQGTTARALDRDGTARVGAAQDRATAGVALISTAAWCPRVGDGGEVDGSRRATEGGSIRCSIRLHRVGEWGSVGWGS